MTRTGKVEIQVKCYSGYAYAERPDSLVYQGKAYKVESIESEWREPGASYFRINTRDKKLFELCYNVQQDEWSLRETG